MALDTSLAPLQVCWSTRVFHVEVTMCCHRHGRHTSWHTPLRSDKRCVSWLFNSTAFLFNAGGPSKWNPFLFSPCMFSTTPHRVPIQPLISLHLPLHFAHPCQSSTSSSSSCNTCPLLVPTCPHSQAPYSPLPISVFPTPFCHHTVGVVSPHVPPFSANKPPYTHVVVFAPPSELSPPFSLSSHCASHHYVSGDARLFCITLFSPLWQAGRHANMQNDDGEAFCRVMRKGRGRHWEWCRCVCMCLCFCLFLTRVFGNRSDGGSGYHPNKSEVEQHGDGITLPYIQRGRIPLFFGLFYT